MKMTHQQLLDKKLQKGRLGAAVFFTGRLVMIYMLAFVVFAGPLTGMFLRSKHLWELVLGGLVVGGFFYYGNTKILAFLTKIWAAVCKFVFRSYAKSDSLQASEYYGLEGAKDDKGEHRCVFCGSGALYSRAANKAKSKNHLNCANCGRYLYTTDQS